MSDLPLPDPTPEEGALDIQHDPFPSSEDGSSRRIPHLGHALLFFALTVTAFLLCLLVLALVSHNHLSGKDQTAVLASIGAEAATYVLALVAAYYFFPPLWKRTFAAGLHWHSETARRLWPRLLAAGILLSVLAQISEHFVKEPKTPEIEQLMRTPLGAWSVMLMGTLLAPAMEEITFRGFLLPALAIAYDWLSLNRTPAALRRWSTTTGNSTPALLFASLFSSLLFALIHAPQLEYAWGPVALLFAVSLVLAYVRVRTGSVACSTVVHLTYNLTIFLAALIATGGFRHLERLQT